MYSASAAVNAPASTLASVSSVSSDANATAFARSFKQASNPDPKNSSAESHPGIRLENVPQPYRARFAFLRTANELPLSHSLDRVLALEPKRFALMLDLKTIKSLTRTNQSTCAAAHLLLRHKPPWPIKRNALYESILGDDYRAFAEYHHNMFEQPEDTFSVRTGPPTWPRIHLEMKAGRCRLESPKDGIRAEFMAEAEQIRIAFSGRQKTIRFDDRRRLAQCGIDVPQKWGRAHSVAPYPPMHAVHATPPFQPVVLSPDERTIFCILEKDGDSAVLQKIQEECGEQIGLPPELRSEIHYISSMACNAAGAVFIYFGCYGAQKLYILEDGHWGRLDLYRPGPSDEPVVNQGAFFISAVSSKGDLVLSPRDRKEYPRLIKRKTDTCDHESRHGGKTADSFQWWKLPKTGSHDYPGEPCIFAFSPGGSHLALTARDFLTIVAGGTGAFILDLRKLSPKSLRIGGHLPSCDLRQFGRTCQMKCPDWHNAQNSVHQNHLAFSFGDGGLTLTKSLYDPDTDTVMSYTAGMWPSTALQPLFAPSAKKIMAEIAKLKAEAETASKPGQDPAHSRPSAHFPSPSNSSPSA